MKNRHWVILLGLLLCLFIAPCPAKADAFETIPAEVQQLFLSQYSQEDVADTLTFSLANGQTCCMILNHFGWLYGYFPQGGRVCSELLQQQPCQYVHGIASTGAPYFI